MEAHRKGCHCGRCLEEKSLDVVLTYTENIRDRANAHEPCESTRPDACMNDVFQRAKSSKMERNREEKSRDYQRRKVGNWSGTPKLSHVHERYSGQHK